MNFKDKISATAEILACGLSAAMVGEDPHLLDGVQVFINVKNGEVYVETKLNHQTVGQSTAKLGEISQQEALDLLDIYTDS